MEEWKGGRVEGCSRTSVRGREREKRSPRLQSGGIE